MANTKKTTAKKAAPKKVSKPVAKKAAPTKKVSKPTPKKVVKPVAKKAAKPVVKKAVKPLAKKASKPVVKAVAAKKAAKPIAKKAVKTVAKPTKKLVKPIAKKASKVVAKVAPKVAAKPVKKAAKPVAKKVVKPVVKKTPASVAKKPIPAKVKKAVKPVTQPAKKVAVAPKPVVKKVEKKPIEQKKAVKVAAVVDKNAKEAVDKLAKVKAPKPKKVIREELPAKALIFLKKPEVKDETPTYNKPTQLRYSDEDLREFKGIIDKKLESAREELVNLKSSLENHTDSQEGNKAWNLEEGSDTSEMEYLMNQISRQNKFIRDLEMALVRIENKTYGVCRVSGKLIDKNRLRIVPHATLSIEAKQSRKGDDHGTSSNVNSAHMGSEGEGFGADDHR